MGRGLEMSGRLGDARQEGYNISKALDLAPVLRKGRQGYLLQ